MFREGLKRGAPASLRRKKSTDTAASIASVEVGGRGRNRLEGIKLTNQLKALEMLGSYLKLFAEDRNPVDLGVKVIIMDAPRPPRLVAATASTQLSSPETRSDASVSAWKKLTPSQKALWATGLGAPAAALKGRK